MDKILRSLKPTAILLVLLMIVGLVLYQLGKPVFWSGFFAMMFFYGLIFFIGAYAGQIRKNDTEEDVMLAGRSIPLFVGVFTMSATWVGGGYINGTAENTYNPDYGLIWVQAPWGYAISLILGGLFFAKKMRRMEYKTMLDPLAQRYGKNMGAVLFLPALAGEIFWTAAILTALGTTFGTVLGIDAQTSIVLSSLIAIAYTALGGLWAVALTDIFQMILLLIGLALVIPFSLEYVGGWDNAWAVYQQNKGAAATFFPNKEALGNYYWNWWDYALLLMLGGIPWQVYFQRVLSARSENAAMWLSILAGVVCIIAAVPAVMIGVIGDAFNTTGDWTAVGAAGAPATSAEILPYVMRYLSNPTVATIGLGAIAAAVMSSVDSSILSASSMAGWNVYKPLFKPNLSSKELAKVIRRMVWIIGIAATLLALQIESVYALWFLCGDFVYCLLFPQLVTAMYDPKANKYGSMAGFAVAFFLRFGGGDATLGIPVMLPYPMIEDALTCLFPFRTLAMLGGLITIIVVSRIWKVKDEDGTQDGLEKRLLD